MAKTKTETETETNTMEKSNANGIDYIEDDERVEINMREVKKMNEPICVIKLKNGNYKQPTKKEIKLLEKMGVNNPCLGKAASNVNPQTTKKVAASSEKGTSSNVTKKMVQAVETSKPAVPKVTTKPTSNVSDLKKELENIELENRQLEAERIAAEEARIAAAAEEDRAKLERNKKLEKIRASRLKAKNEQNEEAERAAKAAEEEAVRAAEAAEAVRAAEAAEAKKEAEDNIAKQVKINKKVKLFVKKLKEKVEQARAAQEAKKAEAAAEKEAAERAAAEEAAAAAAEEAARVAAETARVKAEQDLADQTAADAARVAREEAARVQAEQVVAQAREQAAAEAAEEAKRAAAQAAAETTALEELEQKAKALEAAAQVKAAILPSSLTGIGNATGIFNRKNYTKNIDFPNDYYANMNDGDIIHNTIRVKILKDIDPTKKDDDINSILNYLIRLIKDTNDNKTVFQNKETYHILIQNVIKNIKKSLNSESTSFKFNYDPATIFPPPQNENISSSNKSEFVIKYAYDKEMTLEWLPPGKEINDENKQYKIEYKLASTPDDNYKDFTVDNIVSSFKNFQGGKKHNIKKTTLKKRKGKKYNKKRYTIRKKSLTRNKNRSRTRATKTKKQKRRIKKPRYTKRRY